MKSSWRFVLAWIGALCLLSSAAQAADPDQRSQTRNLTNRILTLFSTDKGLPSSEANAVLQTRDGYLWVASYGGLLRYDGWAFLNYSKEENGLPSSSIRALFEDPAGRLWIGTNNKGVFVFENGEFTACVPEDPTLFESVRCFAADAAGTVYVGTTTGLGVVRDGRLVAVPQMQGEQILSLSADRNGALWGCTKTGVAFCLRNSELAYRFEPGVLSPFESTCVLADDRDVYIGTGKNAMVRLTFRDTAYTPESYQAEVLDTGDISTINTIFRSAEGELWLGGDVGYGWFDSDMELHTLHSTQKVGFVLAIAQDYEGNLWMASSRGGLYRIASGKFYNANARAGLDGLTVNAVARGADGLLYVGADTGLFIADREWNAVVNRVTEFMKGVRIRDVSADSRGNLWFSTYSDMGLVRYTPSTGEVRTLTEKDGLCSNRVRKAQELRNGDVAVASSAGVNIVRDAVVTARYGHEQGLSNPTVLSLLELTDGTLLAGSDGGGIYALGDGAVRVIGKENGLSDGTVLRMREDSRAGGVWVAAGDTLFFMDSNRKVRPISAFRQGTGSLFDILVDGDDVWLMKSDGLRRVSREALLRNKDLDCTEFGARSGLPAGLVANSWNLYENGALYLCTTSGVSILNLTRQTQHTVPPKTVVNAVLLTRGESGVEERILHPKTVTLPKDTRRVTIVFAGLSFGLVPSTIEFALDGFDPAPIRVPASAVTDVSYTNLPGGEYTFHLKAINSDGVESDRETTLVLTKTLNYYEYPQFWVSMALLAALLAVLTGYAAVCIKTRNLKRRQQEYKAITEQALHTIANTIDAKDSYTNGHSIRVGEYSREIARRMGLDEEEQERTYYIGLLHDIGKIGIPDAILNKPSELTEEEYDIMRRHTVIGEEILKNFSALPGIGLGALNHHERFQGQGYPNGIEGKDIPVIGRIIAAADAYDAMATRRTYREIMDVDYIIGEFEKDHGEQFDPEIAAIVVEMIKERRKP